MTAQKVIHKHASTSASKPASEDIQTQIQSLAYQLWLERGAPIGSPEEDWLEAESRLTRAGKSDQ